MKPERTRRRAFAGVISGHLQLPLKKLCCGLCDYFDDAFPYKIAGGLLGQLAQLQDQRLIQVQDQCRRIGGCFHPEPVAWQGQGAELAACAEGQVHVSSADVPAKGEVAVNKRVMQKLENHDLDVIVQVRKLGGGLRSSLSCCRGRVQHLRQSLAIRAVRRTDYACCKAECGGRSRQ